MAYVKDVGNDDVRSEGMSYGMMIAVQLDKKAEFDRIWKWAETYMFQKSGSSYAGYFAWHCSDRGSKLNGNPASDGEEWFATALFFASARWGNGEGIFDYRKEAQAILDTMLHKDEEGSLPATSMFDAETKQVVFVPMTGPASRITDPSYQLPHFYELWARWADKDQAYWKEAAAASRAFLKKATHPVTGLAPDYAQFDGAPTDPRSRRPRCLPLRRLARRRERRPRLSLVQGRSMGGRAEQPADPLFSRNKARATETNFRPRASRKGAVTRSASWP